MTPFPKLSGLPTDVLLEVLDQLEWPHDYAALSLTCRRLHTFTNLELYKTIVIGYARPKALHSLLTKLERDSETCAYVTTLIFDDRAKPMRPYWPSLHEDFDRIPSSRLENRCREPLPRADALLLKIHHKLYAVLPVLHNLKSVYFKRIHPLFLAPPLQHKPPTSTPTRKLKDVVLNNFPLRQLREYQDDSDYPPAAIAIFITHCLSLQRLVIHDPLALRSYWTPSLVANLTVMVLGLNLDNVALELDIEDSRSMLFNGILRRAKQLRTLCLLNTWVNLTLLLEDCYFPFLEGIEWFGFRQKCMDDPATFHDFLTLHSNTLHRLALGHVAYCKGNWGHVIPRSRVSGGRWLESETVLPNLETLRLQHWEAYATPQPVYEVTESDRLNTAIMIAQFILHRPSIIDVALTDLPSSVATILLEGMQATRTIKRVMFGKTERVERNARVPRFPPLDAVVTTGTLFSEYERSKAQWAFQRKREYLLEAYESYIVMFQGLELEKSAFRPYLLPRRKNAKRDYRR